MAIGRDFLLKDGKLTFEFKEPFNWVAELNKSKSYNMSIVRGWLDIVQTVHYVHCNASQLNELSTGLGFRP